MRHLPHWAASSALEYGISWLPWILRGVYPPPGMPPQYGVPQTGAQLGVRVNGNQ